MSLIYNTTLSPSKYELLAAWLPSRLWFVGDAALLEPVGAYRFDDPDGEVGFEGHLFTAGDDTVYHLPLSYRGGPLDGGNAFLAGTLEHGVLGERWVYEAIGDPVFRAVIGGVIAQGGTGSREFIVDDAGSQVEREPSVRVAGTGSLGVVVPELWAALVEVRGTSSVARTDFASLEVHHVVVPENEGTDDAEGVRTLRAAWGGGRVGVPLASLRA